MMFRLRHALLSVATLTPAGAFAQLSLTSATGQHWYMLIDSAGNVVSQQPLEQFRSFRNGFAAASPGNNKRTWIDASGKRLTTDDYVQVSDFNAQGFAMARKPAGPAIVIDRKGAEARTVEAPASGMLKRRAPVVSLMTNAPYAMTGEKFGKLGLIDVNGRELFTPTYSAIGEFSEGLASVSVGRSHEDLGWVDTTGTLVIAVRFTRARTIDWNGDLPMLRGEFHEGRAAVRDGNLEGFINRKGEMVIRPRWPATGDFHDGFARVRLPGENMTTGWTFIDTTGKQTSTTFAAAADFHNGYARVKMRDGRDVLVTRDMTIAPKLLGPFTGDMGDNGMIGVKRADGASYIHRDGRIAIPASKLSAYVNVGYEFTAGRTVVERPRTKASK